MYEKVVKWERAPYKPYNVVFSNVRELCFIRMRGNLCFFKFEGILGIVYPVAEPEFMREPKMREE